MNISSDFACPELRLSTGFADVHFHFGEISSLPEGSARGGIVFEVSPGKYLLNISGVARYLVSNGAEIVVDPAPAADVDAVRLFLLGSGMGALLHQRRVLPLHASAIVTPRGAVVLAGPSGSGKSTLAAALVRRGFGVLADDVCVVDTSEAPAVMPGTTSLMLWSDALRELGIENSGLYPVRAGLQKYRLPGRNDLSPRPVRLHAVYILNVSHSDTVALAPIAGFAKFEALTANTFRNTFIQPMNLAGSHFRQVGRVADFTRMRSVIRPRDGFRIDELADMLIEDFEL